MGLQHLIEHIMNGALRGGRHAQIDDPCTEAIQEDDATEVPVSGYKQPVPPLRYLEQFFVRGSRETEISGANDVVPRVQQMPGGRCVDVLVEQELQTDAARKRISSAPTKAIA